MSFRSGRIGWKWSFVLTGLFTCAACWGGGDVVRSDDEDESKAAERALPAEVVPQEQGEEEATSGHHVGALETYRYWAGADPEEGVRVLNGEYWSSAHWSKEYSLYMELRFPGAKDFVMSRNFKRSETRIDPPEGSPTWFAPPADYQVWTGAQGSYYYLHPGKGHLYMYEVQF